MSTAYYPDNEIVAQRALKVQTLCIPFVITGSATSGSVTVTTDEPSLLFINTQGVNQITGALAAADTAPTYTSANDGSGVFNILVCLQGEQVGKVCGASVIRMDTAEVFAATYPSAPSTGIVAGGLKDKIALNATSTSALTSGTHQLVLYVDYVVSET